MYWYKRDPNAALIGMATLSLEDRGAYNTILDLLYASDGNLSDDDRAIAKLMHIQLRTWLPIKKRLTEAGKIWSFGGKISAKRVEKELKTARELSEKQSEIAGKRWEKEEKPKENNEDAMPSGNAITSTSTPTPTKKDIDGEKKVSGKPRKQPEVPLPSDWKPTVSSIEKAQKLGFNPHEIAREAEKFKNHARQNDRRAVRWEAAFDNWIINSAAYQNKAPPAEKAETFPAMPGSPEFLAWKAHYQDAGNKHMVHLLNQRELEGRPWHFPSKWPPGHKVEAA